MVICLGYGGAVAGEAPLALAVGLAESLIDLRGVRLQPGEERRPEVEADPGVVVDDALDQPVLIKDPRGGVGSVALNGNPLVPVMIRTSPVLLLYDLQPGILSRRLVKMAVDAEIALQRGITREWFAGERESVSG
jgi:hypothetical protein